MIKYDEEKIGIPRSSFVKALNAEGIPHWEGYVEPLYLLPLYQKRICFGSKGFPFTSSSYKGNVSYEKGICPVVERMYEKEVFLNDLCRTTHTKSDIDDIVNAFYKVLENKDELKNL